MIVTGISRSSTGSPTGAACSAIGVGMGTASPTVGADAIASGTGPQSRIGATFVPGASRYATSRLRASSSTSARVRAP
jgi:hypothetical protein